MLFKREILEELKVSLVQYVHHNIYLHNILNIEMLMLKFLVFEFKYLSTSIKKCTLLSMNLNIYIENFKFNHLNPRIRNLKTCNWIIEP